MQLQTYISSVPLPQLTQDIINLDFEKAVLQERVDSIEEAAKEPIMSSEETKKLKTRDAYWNGVVKRRERIRSEMWYMMKDATQKTSQELAVSRALPLRLSSIEAAAQ